MHVLDSDGDGSIDQQELLGSPGLAFAASQLDKNSDGHISRAELQERFELYEQSRLGITPQGLRLSLNGRPLARAEVQLVPEPWLGGLIKPALGTTDSTGTVYPVTAGQDLPGMQLGFYRVMIKSAHLTNEQATQATDGIGLEVSPVDDSGRSTDFIHLELNL